MTWIAISDRDGCHYSPSGFAGQGARGDLIDTAPGALMVRGSLVIETRLPVSHRPRQLLYYNRAGDWPVHLSVQALPEGGVTLVLDQGGEIVHRTINHSEAGRTDVLRITYAWDSPARRGRLALERTDSDQVLVAEIPAPRPLPAGDAVAMVRPGDDLYVAPDVLYVALSDEMEPVGPMPTLMPDTPIATPTGYRAVGDMRRGDLVLTPGGDQVPVLQVLSRQVPARGCFAPVRLRAPYFGLQQDITLAPSQRLALSGSEVEYLFGQETVLVPVRHLVGTGGAVRESTGPIATYSQLLLPRHEAMIAAGTVIESLFIGRLRRKKSMLAASVLDGLDRSALPEHGRPIHPVLHAFEAIFLAERRAA